MQIEFDHYNELVEKTEQFIQEFNTNELIQIQTSGSTGKKKKYEVEKKKFLISAKRTCDFFNLKESDRAYLCISPEYIGGKMMIVRSKLRNLILEIGSLKSQPLEKIKSYDFAAFVPFQINCIIEEDINYLKNIKNIIIGGGVLNPKTETILAENNINAYVTFGMTETLSHIALRKVGETHYQVLEGVEIEQNDEDCLIILDEKLTGIEKLVTNDVIELVGAKKFKWIGRKDNVINSGGIKIYPEEIESKLREEIDCHFFIGKENDDKLGEKLILVVESESEIKIDFSPLHKYEIPKSIYFIKEFIYTETNKINRPKTLKSII